MNSRRSWTNWSIPFLMTLLCAFLVLPRTLIAQQQADDTGYKTTESGATLDQQSSGSGYTVSESAADKAADKGDLKSEGPVRMARFAYVTGNVTWRAGSTGDWAQATVNMPIRQGAEILVLKGGRADIQFDDGSALRLGNGALITLKTLYSDDKGEFTQITLKDGLATLHSRHTDAVYQVDTPIVSVKSVGPSQVRFGVDGGSEVAVQMGTANIEGPSGKTTVKQGNYIYLAAANSDYKTRPTPAPDTWDNWNGDRNRLIAGTSETYKHVPPNIGLVAEDLDGYGTWHQDATNGWVWSPTNQPQGWRPYSDGNWDSVDPYGWTWVSNEPWGWAPYHYGTWCQTHWGWSWCPGPRFQYWSPGVVSFSSYNGGFCWAPLCPWEVVYPTYCGLGFWGPNWCFDFSIGWCGCYFPFGGRFCEGRRFDNRFVNGFRNGDRFGDHGGFRNGLGSNVGGHGFEPFNARSAAGATFASREAISGRGSYQAMSKGTNAFGSGRTIGASGGREPMSGPSSIRAASETRTAARGSLSGGSTPGAAGRSTFEGSVPSNVARGSSSSSSSSNSFARSGASTGGADAARAARASLGNYVGSSGAGSRSSSSFGGYSGRTSGGFGESTRSSGFGGYSGESRSFGGSSAGSYRVGPSYRGSGFSGGSSGGSRSFGGSTGGGAHSGGGGGGGGHR